MSTLPEKLKPRTWQWKWIEREPYDLREYLSGCAQRVDVMSVYETNRKFVPKGVTMTPVTDPRTGKATSVKIAWNTGYLQGFIGATGIGGDGVGNLDEFADANGHILPEYKDAILAEIRRMFPSFHDKMEWVSGCALIMPLGETAQRVRSFMVMNPGADDREVTVSIDNLSALLQETMNAIPRDVVARETKACGIKVDGL